MIGDGDAIGDLARGGQRLQNADGGGGGLDHARDDRADEHAEQRVLKRRQDARKGLGILQTGNGASHERHAVHRTAKPTMILPMSRLRGFLHIMMSTTPINAMIGEKFSGLSSWIQPVPFTPDNDKIHGVSVVPDV